jgi:hypothetical protein
MTIIALIMTSVKRRRDIVDILGFDVAGNYNVDQCREEADIFFGFLISIFLISVHILYVVDVTVGLPWPS